MSETPYILRDRPEATARPVRDPVVPSDPLSDVLSLLKPQSFLAGGFDIGGDWAIAFAAPAGIKCYAVVSGGCWLVVDDAPPVAIEAGDCFLLPRRRAFRLASDLAVPPRDFRDALHEYLPPRQPGHGGIPVIAGGGTCVVGGHFSFGGVHVGVLLDALPPIVHLREPADRVALRWSIERMIQELRDPRPGSALMAQHLSHMMLLTALRLHLADGQPNGKRGGVSWLFALADRQLAAAIEAMHREPARSWTVQALAACAGMSRSVFAQRFREAVGIAPLGYLTRWRMLLASDRLLADNAQVGSIALALGYASESAFSTAFRREIGISPRRYARGGMAKTA